MPVKGKELLEELKTVVTGKTLDAILPLFVYVLANGLFGLSTAIASALGFALIICFYRLLRKQAWQYALGGLLGVIIAAGLAYLTRSAISYFIPAIISSGLLLLLSVASVITGKPLAAWASHLTRGWPLEWFWRKDVKPAYFEVTWFWIILITIRLIAQLTLFRAGNVTRLAWANTLLGWPVIVVVLIITYIYGIWRLRKLGGPGVDEFQKGKTPPWEGQKRGF